MPLKPASTVTATRQSCRFPMNAAGGPPTTSGSSACVTPAPTGGSRCTGSTVRLSPGRSARTCHAGHATAAARRHQWRGARPRHRRAARHPSAQPAQQVRGASSTETGHRRPARPQPAGHRPSCRRRQPVCLPRPRDGPIRSAVHVRIRPESGPGRPRVEVWHSLSGQPATLVTQESRSSSGKELQRVARRLPPGGPARKP